MALTNIFSSNLISSAKVISKDSKIYEAFKPYLSSILGISLESYMKNKDVRRTYRQKYAEIKSKFQEESSEKASITDEECFIRIAEYGRQWQEFITTACEYTLDNGKSFIRSTPLDSYILMTSDQKRDLEQRLVTAAVQRIKYISDNCSITSDQTELNAILNDQRDSALSQNHVGHKG